MLEHPQKKHFRTRAHSNVLNANDFWFPATPADVPVAQYYPARPTERIEFVDVGCGYGSLLLALSAHFPQQLSLGIEIRPKVVEYVQRRVVALRHEASRAAAEKTDADESAAAVAIASAEGSQRKAVENGGPQRSGASEALPPNFSHAQLKAHALVDHPTHDRPTHDNVWAVHNNAMRFLPNFFEKGQLTKLFFCFPDPHFKRKNHRKRIISTPLLAEFAYVIRPGGLVYLITDVSELMEWMVRHLIWRTYCKTSPIIRFGGGVALSTDQSPHVYQGEGPSQVGRPGRG